MHPDDPRMAGLAPDAVAALQAAARAIRDNRLDEADRLFAGVRAQAPAHAEALRIGAILRLRYPRDQRAAVVLRCAHARAAPSSGLCMSCRIHALYTRLLRERMTQVPRWRSFF